MSRERHQGAGAIVIAFVAACQLDTSGVGVPSNMLATVDSSGAAADSGDDDGANASDSGTTGASATGGSAGLDTAEPTTGADTSGDPGDTSTSGPDESTTGPVEMCAGDLPQFVLSVTADQAILAAPMMLDAQDGTPYVYSEVEQMGTATFTFDVPCPDEYMFHGFVYDGAPGAWNVPTFMDNGADSYAVQVGGANAAWSYGCQNGGIFPPNWQWQPVSSNAGCLMGNDKLMVALPAGTHTLTLLNLETGTHGDGDPGSAAAMSVLVVTNDASYSP